MSMGSVFVLILIAALVLFFIIAIRRRWIAPSSGGIFTSQIAMHNLATKDKQKAMEYIIEDQENQNRGKEDTGEGPKGGTSLNEQ